jgi:hypothetical protein
MSTSEADTHNISYFRSGVAAKSGAVRDSLAMRFHSWRQELHSRLEGNHAWTAGRTVPHAEIFGNRAAKRLAKYAHDRSS